ncbi:Ig-like domain-containing protein, partial [Undibacterium sp.]|uniref:Ig-like domain-containing protein n=1 Tax=Undibacterium sp. TaxID=1914977 RepID=UPI002C8F79ED
MMIVSLVDQSSNPANLLTSSGALTAKVKVTNATGQPVSGAVVLFTVANSSLATVSPASNLTDANGTTQATVTLPAPDAVGATTITANTSYTDSTGTTISLAGSTNFKVGNVQNAPQSILLVSISPADKSILLQGNTGGGRVQTAQVTFKITDLNGLAVANQKVKFTFQQAPVDLTFATDTAVSGQDGNVTAVVNSGNTVTVVTVIATVVDQNNNPILNRNGLPITAVSDQITVTNTVLSPNGISLSQDKFSIEGWDFDGDFSTITARLTDLQGGQITDGTAVTFTTN